MTRYSLPCCSIQFKLSIPWRTAIKLDVLPVLQNPPFRCLPCSRHSVRWANWHIYSLSPVHPLGSLFLRNYKLSPSPRELVDHWSRPPWGPVSQAFSDPFLSLQINRFGDLLPCSRFVGLSAAGAAGPVIAGARSSSPGRLTELSGNSSSWIFCSFKTSFLWGTVLEHPQSTQQKIIRIPIWVKFRLMLMPLASLSYPSKPFYVNPW